MFWRDAPITYNAVRDAMSESLDNPIPSRRSGLSPLRQNHSNNPALRFSLCRRQCLRMSIQGDPAVRVPQRFLNDLHIFTIRFQLSRIAVPKRVPAKHLLNDRIVSLQSKCVGAKGSRANRAMRVNSPSAHRHKPLRIPSPFDLDV
jgi:hypothetical protein